MADSSVSTVPTQYQQEQWWSDHMYDACLSDDLKEIRKMVLGGCPIDYIDKKNHPSPFLVACSKNYKDLVDFCIEKGARFYQTPTTTSTELAKHGNAIMMKYLFDSSPLTPLFMNEKDEDGNTIVHICVTMGHKELFKLLLYYNAESGLVNSKWQTPLHVAAISGNLEYVKDLLNNDKFYPINIQDYKGNTALHYACNRDYVEITMLLLERGTDYNLENADNKTAYDLAQQYSSRKCCNILQPLTSSTFIKPLKFDGFPEKRIDPDKDVVTNIPPPEFNVYNTLTGENELYKTYFTKDIKHKPYFYNTFTKQTTWKDPRPLQKGKFGILLSSEFYEHLKNLKAENEKLEVSVDILKESSHLDTVKSLKEKIRTKQEIVQKYYLKIQELEKNNMKANKDEEINALKSEMDLIKEDIRTKKQKQEELDIKIKRCQSNSLETQREIKLIREKYSKESKRIIDSYEATLAKLNKELEEKQKNAVKTADQLQYERTIEQKIQKRDQLKAKLLHPIDEYSTTLEENQTLSQQFDKYNAQMKKLDIQLLQLQRRVETK